LLSLCLSVGVVWGHGLHHTVSEGEAVVITISYAEGMKFAHERYEIYRPGEEVPFQSGTTDGLGRIAFVPDRDGDWRLRAFSKDGHGLDVRVSTSARGLELGSRDSRSGGHERIVLGVAIIIAVFGAVSLLYRAKG